MNNYEFCADWVLKQAPERSFKVLDYGCGSGKIIKSLRLKGIDAFGCDMFYEGGDRAASVDPELFSGGFIRRMNGNAIPFDAGEFDFVVNNQVLEHVEDIDVVLKEIARVLRPDGLVLSVFPDKGVWREGHCGIPFLHWFPKGSRTRVFYAAGLNILGLGYHRAGKSPMSWGRHFCQYLDNWTHYRTWREISSAFKKNFTEVSRIEPIFLRKRLGSRNYLVSWLPSSIQGFIVKKLAGTVMVARKAV